MKKIYFKRFGEWYNSQYFIVRLFLVFVGVNGGFIAGRLLGGWLF